MFSASSHTNTQASSTAEVSGDYLKEAVLG